MLIYNSKKEFIGIDEKDLKALGYNNLSSLKTEVTDFADLFVKTPGFIHNFKHVHWIDFITCADSNEAPKVIINVNNKNFKSMVTIENIFLSDHPSSKGYIVYLNNLRELSKKESESISGDIVVRSAPQVAPAMVAPEIIDEFDAPEEVESIEAPQIQEDLYETPLEVDFDIDDGVEETLLEEPNIAQEEEIDDILDVGDLSFDTEEISQPQSEPHTTTELVSEKFDNGYIYDPHVASEELGLPLDLIEEFIQDFIAQAKEFKDDIYTALNNGELDQVKILSHKLKGVAANLRIEDAFETLSVVNTAEEMYVIRENLDTFYKIIAKLSGEEIVVEKELPQETQDRAAEEKVAAIEKVADTEEFELDLKEEFTPTSQETFEEITPTTPDKEEDDLYGNLLDIEDSAVPQKIEMAELADDDYLASDVDIDSIESEIDEIEDIGFLEEEEPLIKEELVKPEKQLDIVIDYPKERVAAEIGIDIESFNELLDDYINESRLTVEKIKEAIKNDDYSSSQHETMKLKGMSDNMRVKDFTQELETLMHSSDKDQTSQAIQTIEMLLSQISKIEV